MQLQATYLAQRRVRGAHVVSAIHPVLGPLYWNFVSNADCNAPDYYGLTQHIDQALRVAGDWRKSNFGQRQHEFTRAKGLYPLAAEYGVSRSEVYGWLQTAQWESVPAPDQLFWFAGMDGFWGNTPSWEDRPSEAMEFSAEQVALKDVGCDDLDFEAARGRGEFVLKAEAIVAWNVLQEKMPHPPAKPILPEALPFTLTITKIEDEADEYGNAYIHFDVSGAVPSEDDIEALFECMTGSDDDGEDPNEFCISYDPTTLRGWWVVALLSKCNRNVGQTHADSTRNRSSHA